MRIGILGAGVTGGALIRWFKISTAHELSIYDPGLNLYGTMAECNVVFICVPIPTLVSGDLDFDILRDAISRTYPNQDVFLRSTALPGTADRFGLWSCPEFLTEACADDEMDRLGIVTGSPNIRLLDEIFPGKEVIHMENREAELAKYAHNVFGALKVTYFNIIHALSQSQGSNYERILEGILMTGFIDPNHTRVPGPDGHYGYGGACFPKDVAAFSTAYPYELLKEIDTLNKIFRSPIDSERDKARFKACETTQN